MGRAAGETWRDLYLSRAMARDFSGLFFSVPVAGSKFTCEPERRTETWANWKLFKELYVAVYVHV
jgi:hypothetical protein